MRLTREELEHVDELLRKATTLRPTLRHPLIAMTEWVRAADDALLHAEEVLDEIASDGLVTGPRGKMTLDVLEKIRAARLSSGGEGEGK